jgi:hypothetical protein
VWFCTETNVAPDIGLGLREHRTGAAWTGVLSWGFIYIRPQVQSKSFTSVGNCDERASSCTGMYSQWFVPKRIRVRRAAGPNLELDAFMYVLMYVHALIVPRASFCHRLQARRIIKSVHFEESRSFSPVEHKAKLGATILVRGSVQHVSQVG